MIFIILELHILILDRTRGVIKFFIFILRRAKVVEKEDVIQMLRMMFLALKTINLLR